MRRGGSSRSVTLDASDRDGIARLRAALRVGRYDVPHLRPMLRADSDNLTPRPSDVPIVLRLLPEGDRLATLVRLFLLTMPVPASAAREALAPLPVERAIRLGIVRRVPEGVASTVRILPAGELVFACDRLPEGSPDLSSDHVMGPASSSILLASLTSRERVARTLDVGAGAGIQSVFAAPHSDTVVACDINPRALNFTAFNAALNGVRNVECRAGSFFEPVGDELFDLIVSNPPFVISPESTLVFRDSGMRGDEVSRIVLRGAAAHLREGGLAFVLISWGLREAQEWSEPLRPWVDGLGCDAWFFQQSQDPALLYAASWNSPLQIPRPDEFGAAVDRWVAHLRELGFASVGYGAAILRRRSAERNWIRAEDMNGQRAPASAKQVALLFRSQDYLDSLSDERDLLDARLELVPEHRLDQVLRCRDGGFVVEAAALSLETGVRFHASIDAFSAFLLGHFDGRRTLREAVTATAGKFAADGISEAEFTDAAIPVVRRMLALGFLRLATA